MGNREDLLVGAMRCLAEKGYARTTARDIVQASGTNLASIGYHFGSKDALLNEALMAATEEWGERLREALDGDGDRDSGSDARPFERFEAIWTRIVELFTAHRGLWAANFEVLAQIDHVPQMRKVLADGAAEARSGLAAIFHPADQPRQAELRQAVGAFYQALLMGVMAQWTFDPEHAPTGRELADALRVIVAALGLERARDADPAAPEPRTPEAFRATA